MTVTFPSLSYIKTGILSYARSAIVSAMIGSGEALGIWAYLAELPDELSAHATRACRRADVCGYSQGADITLFGTLDISLSIHVISTVSWKKWPYLNHSRAQSHPLSAGANWVCRILYVGTLYNGTIGEQE